MNEDIRNHILSYNLADDVENLADDASLLESGAIDSVAMVGLIAFLEKTYSITVDEDDLMPENFDSVNAIVAYVRGRQGAL